MLAGVFTDGERLGNAEGGCNSVSARFLPEDVGSVEDVWLEVSSNLQSLGGYAEAKEIPREEAGGRGGRGGRGARDA